MIVFDAWDRLGLHLALLLLGCLSALWVAGALYGALQARRERRRRVLGRRVPAPMWACRRLTNGQWVVERRS